jgi:hypothetical protein
MTRISACFVWLLCYAGVCYSFLPTVNLTGYIADAQSHQPVSSAAIIIQVYSGIGGKTFQDSEFSDSQGRFRMTLSDSNRYSPGIIVEKEGYKTISTRLPSLNAPSLFLDTIFLSRYSQADSVSYSISGTVTNAYGDGIHNALVTVTLSQGPLTPALVFRDSTALGGYFTISTKRPYQTTSVLIGLHLEKAGFTPVDTDRTFASSTQSFIFNVQMKRSPEAVIPVARSLTKAITTVSRTVTINGRRCTAAAGYGRNGQVVVTISREGNARVITQIK